MKKYICELVIQESDEEDSETGCDGCVFQHSESDSHCCATCDQLPASMTLRVLRENNGVILAGARHGKTCCLNCGGALVGDGYTQVRHCENVEPPADAEPDSGPLWCNWPYAEEAE